MKIKLSEPDGPYHADIDTDVMEVEIRQAYIGAVFVADDGARLAVCMRDDGFEVRHTSGAFDGGWVEFKGSSGE